MPQNTARPDVDEVSTLNQARIFLQWCGPLPTNDVVYSGQDTQYLALEGSTRPPRGGITPIRVPDPGRLKKFKFVGRSEEAADFPTATLRLLESHGDIPIQWGPMDQPINLYVYRGLCESLDNPSMIEDMVEIYSWGLFTTTDFGTRTPAWDSDDMVDDSAELTLGAIYAVGRMQFAPRGSDFTNTEVIDGTYGAAAGCGRCGYTARDGISRVYFVTRQGGSSPGLLPEILYTPDGGSTWLQKSIESFTASEQPLAIRVVGNYLLVLGTNSYSIAPLNARTGTVGTFTKVTTGFDATYSPTDVIAISSREIIFTALSGRIYRSTNILAGVTLVSQGDATTAHLRRIRGQANCLVAVGDSGAVVFSTDGGITWIAAPTVPVNWGLRAVEALDPYRWWVGAGAGNGRVYYTVDGGNSWVELTGLDSADAINDIVFATDEVGWIAYRTTTPAARLAATWTGGNVWVQSSSAGQSRIQNLPVHAGVNRIAVPDTHPTLAAANIALAGSVAVNGDGLIVFGKSTLR